MRARLLMCCVFISVSSVSATAEEVNVDKALQEVRELNVERSKAERRAELTETMGNMAESLARIRKAGYRLNEDNELVPLEGSSTGDSGADSFPVGLSQGQSSPGMLPGPGGLSGPQFTVPEQPFQPQQAEPAIYGGASQGVMDYMPAGQSASDQAGAPIPELHAVINKNAVFEIDGDLVTYGEGDALPGGHTLLSVEVDSVSLETGDGKSRSVAVDWRKKTVQDGQSNTQGQNGGF